MKIWNGNKNDTTNFTTDKYLQINSCGFQNVTADYTVVREKGRFDYHILMINSGICDVLHNGKIYTLTAGNLVLYAPLEEQRYTFKADTSSLWCHFTGTFVQEILASCGMSSGVYFFNPNKYISEAYSELIQRFHQPGRKNFANASLLELIYHIQDSMHCPEQKKNFDLLLPTLNYINMNYNKQITLEQLAKQSGYSRSRFSHIFSEITGTTPIKYLNDIRLKASCEMLSSTNLGIGDISLRCGFNDPLYYSKLFFRKYNTTPSNYRLSLSSFK